MWCNSAKSRLPRILVHTVHQVIGALQRINYSERHTQALILAPTRELANQRLRWNMKSWLQKQLMCEASKVFQNLWMNCSHAPRIYKVALALGDYLKVRAHACIGGRHSKIWWCSKLVLPQYRLGPRCVCVCVFVCVCVCLELSRVPNNVCEVRGSDSNMQHADLKKSKYKKCLKMFKV